MFLLRSEQELLNSFIRRDRFVELPKELKFPLVVRDYFAWTDSSGLRTYLVFSEPEVKKPIGIVFDRPTSGTPTAAVCEWCHCYGSSNQIGLLTLEAGSKRRVGVHLCLDLSCHDKIEADLSLTPEAARRRHRRVVDCMARFVRRTVL